MSKFEDQIREYAPEFLISDAEVEKYLKYEELLRLWNARFNLVSRNSLENAFALHFVDSICLADVGRKYGVGHYVDLGTGAGFPGAIFNIRHATPIQLFERTGKKRKFLEELKAVLSLNFEIGAEFIGMKSTATVFARAVSPPQELLRFLGQNLFIGSHVIVALAQEDPANVRVNRFHLVGHESYELPLGFGTRTAAVFELRST